MKGCPYPAYPRLSSTFALAPTQAVDHSRKSIDKTGSASSRQAPQTQAFIEASSNTYPWHRMKGVYAGRSRGIIYLDKPSKDEDDADQSQSLPE